MAIRAGSVILNILNVKRQETGTLLSMVAHAFFSGLAIAISYITILKLIVYKKGAIDLLPTLFVIAAVLLLIGGLVYSRIEHHTAPRKLFLMVLVGCAFWGLLARLSMGWSDSLVIVGLIFSTYFLVYMLSNLEFWGVAALLFDIRQGKRLFGPLAVGESIAKIIGYGSVALITSLMSSKDALLVAGVCFFISFLILRKLVRQSPAVFEAGDDHSADQSPTRYQTLGLGHVIRSLQRNSFIRWIGIFSLFGLVIYTTINYGFLERVEYEFKGEKEITNFLATFLIVAKVINLLIKTAFSSRILNYFGLKVGLLTLPVAILLISGIGLVGFFNFTPGMYFFIGIFAALEFTREALQTSIYTPSYLLLFQPLAKNKRLEGHTLTKGIMEPAGMGLAGIGIILLQQGSIFTLSNLIIYLILLCVVWLLSSLKLVREYLQILEGALKSRLMGRVRFNLSKEEIRKLREEKLDTDDLYELVYVAKLLENELTGKEIGDIVERLLQSGEDSLLIEAFNLVDRHKLHEFGDRIKELIFSDNVELSKSAAQSYTSLREEECVSELVHELDRATRPQRFAIIGALLKNTGLYGAVSIGDEFLQLIESEREEDRIEAAAIIGEVGNEKYYHPLIILLKDPSPEVRKQAIDSAGRVQNIKLVPPILDQLEHRKMLPYCQRTLERFGSGIVPVLELRLHTASRDVCRGILRITGRLRDPEASQLLLKYLRSDDHLLRDTAINSLFVQKYQTDDRSRSKLMEELESNIDAIRKIVGVCRQKQMDGKLHKALYNEVSNVLIPQTLRLISFIYEHKPIKAILENTSLSGGDFRSNALELLENLLKRSHSRKLVPQVEEVLNLDFREKKGIGPGCPPEKVINVLKTLRRCFISDWLAGICVRSARVHEIGGLENWFEGFAENRILKQELSLYYQAKKDTAV